MAKSILVIDKRAETAEELQRALEGTVAFDSIEHTRSVLKGLQSLNEEQFALCVMDEGYDQDDIEAFFADVLEGGHHRFCTFIQIRKERPTPEAEPEILGLGFQAIVTHRFTAEDRETLARVLKSSLREQEVQRRQLDVGAAMKLLLEDVDRVAGDRKRGVGSKFNTISMGFIEMQTEFAQEILTQYFQKLQDETASKSPPAAVSVRIPELVLKRNLPKLSEKGYTGASWRVWKKLLAKYGVAVDSTAATEEATPETSKE